jgi:hypothetical protein
MNKDNSKAIPKSSLIKLTWVGGFATTFLHFKHMVIENWNVSNND